MFIFKQPRTVEADGDIQTDRQDRNRRGKCTVKKVPEFPVPSRDVTVKLSLGGNNDVITELFLPRGSLVSDIKAGDEKLVNLFYGVGVCYVVFALHI
jgi:hypothetical protein